MNPDTGHLVRIDSEEEMRRLAQDGYERLPGEMNRAARRKLARQKEAQVSLTSGGRLSRWAAKRRRARRKMAGVSRRRNRG